MKALAAAVACRCSRLPLQTPDHITPAVCILQSSTSDAFKTLTAARTAKLHPK